MLLHERGGGIIFLLVADTLRKKGFYLQPKKGSSKGSRMGTAEEPFKVLDSTFFRV